MLLLCFGADPTAQMRNTVAPSASGCGSVAGSVAFPPDGRGLRTYSSEGATGISSKSSLTHRRNRSRLLAIHNKPTGSEANSSLPSSTPAANQPNRALNPLLGALGVADSAPGDWDAVMLAVLAQRLDLVQLLLQAGASPDSRTRAGNSALWLLATYGWPRLPEAAAETYSFGQANPLGGLHLPGNSMAAAVIHHTAKQADQAIRPVAQLLLESAGLLETVPRGNPRESSSSLVREEFLALSSSASQAAHLLQSARPQDRRGRERAINELLWMAARSGLPAMPGLLGQVPDTVLHGPVLRRLGIRSMLSVSLGESVCVACSVLFSIAD